MRESFKRNVENMSKLDDNEEGPLKGMAGVFGDEVVEDQSGPRRN